MEDKKKEEMADEELRIAKLAVLYELRLRFTQSEKESYTVEEIAEKLDEMAREAG